MGITCYLNFALCTSDQNECEVFNGLCAHTCTNTNGSYFCSCEKGYQLGTEGRNCTGKFKELKLKICKSIVEWSKGQDYRNWVNFYTFLMGNSMV